MIRPPPGRTERWRAAGGTWPQANSRSYRAHERARRHDGGAIPEAPGQSEEPAASRSSVIPSAASPSAGPHGPEQSGGDPGVAQRTVVVVPAQSEGGAALGQVGPSFHSEVGVGHRPGVDRGDIGEDGRRSPEAHAFGPQKGKIETVHVVPDHHPARQEGGQVAVDGAVGGRLAQHGGGDAVDVGRARGPVADR